MLAPGSRVEGYEVVSLVAVGAMCHVYEARSEHAARSVAVKALHEALCADEDIVTRFFNEASVLRSIQHPYIVPLLAAGTLPSGSPYMVLEWLPSDLARALADGDEGCALPLRTAARLASQIASALLALHSRGIIHRDLKPANVLLDACDLGVAEVRLADLGLAKVRSEAGGEQSAVGHVSTGGSVMLGTWDYMAPEQWIKSKTAGAQADVYSLGVLLFQMLVGRLPFVAEQPKDLMALHLFENPPMDRLGEQTPPALRDLVGRMLNKIPSTRPSMQEVIGQLDSLR
ncbi:serine/threonine-protein kinase [Sorangium sp. So ce1153]|uniref:serine/threonine-protein kinase n=1 Tax=Sorangium sp. So ce1153 TaxID=3133333 RepID=UPI003F613B63